MRDRPHLVPPEWWRHRVCSIPWQYTSQSHCCLRSPDDGHGIQSNALQTKQGNMQTALTNKFTKHAIIYTAGATLIQCRFRVQQLGSRLEVCTGSKLKPEPGPYPRSSDPTRAARLNLEPKPDPKSKSKKPTTCHVNLRLRVSLYKQWGLVTSKTAILPPHCR